MENNETNNVVKSLFGRHAGRKFVALMAFFVLVGLSPLLGITNQIPELGKALGWFMLAQTSADVAKNLGQFRKPQTP